MIFRYLVCAIVANFSVGSHGMNTKNSLNLLSARLLSQLLNVHANRYIALAYKPLFRVAYGISRIYARSAAVYLVLCIGAGGHIIVYLHIGAFSLGPVAGNLFIGLFSFRFFHGLRRPGCAFRYVYLLGRLPGLAIFDVLIT